MIKEGENILKLTNTEKLLLYSSEYPHLRITTQQERENLIIEANLVTQQERDEWMANRRSTILDQIAHHQSQSTILDQMAEIADPRWLTAIGDEKMKMMKMR